MNNQETEMKIKYKLHIVIEKYKHKPKQKFEVWKIHNLKWQCRDGVNNNWMTVI